MSQQVDNGYCVCVRSGAHIPAGYVLCVSVVIIKYIGLFEVSPDGILVDVLCQTIAWGDLLTLDIIQSTIKRNRAVVKAKAFSNATLEVVNSPVCDRRCK